MSGKASTRYGSLANDGGSNAKVNRTKSFRNSKTAGPTLLLDTSGKTQKPNVGVQSMNNKLNNSLTNKANLLDF